MAQMFFLGVLSILLLVTQIPNDVTDKSGYYDLMKRGIRIARFNDSILTIIDNFMKTLVLFMPEIINYTPGTITLIVPSLLVYTLLATCLLSSPGAIALIVSSLFL